MNTGRTCMMQKPDNSELHYAYWRDDNGRCDALLRACVIIPQGPAIRPGKKY